MVQIRVALSCRREGCGMNIKALPELFQYNMSSNLTKKYCENDGVTSYEVWIHSALIQPLLDSKLFVRLVEREAIASQEVSSSKCNVGGLVLKTSAYMYLSTRDLPWKNWQGKLEHPMPGALPFMPGAGEGIPQLILVMRLMNMWLWGGRLTCLLGKMGVCLLPHRRKSKVRPQIVRTRANSPKWICELQFETYAPCHLANLRHGYWNTVGHRRGERDEYRKGMWKW